LTPATPEICFARGIKRSELGACADILRSRALRAMTSAQLKALLVSPILEVEFDVELDVELPANSTILSLADEISSIFAFTLAAFWVSCSAV